jgi:hypothetical protein
MSHERGEETSPEELDPEELSPDTRDPRGRMLWQELRDNVVEPRAQPAGLTYEGPGEPGEGTEPEDSLSREVVPGVLGGPPVIVTREDEPAGDRDREEEPAGDRDREDEEPPGPAS